MHQHQDCPIQKKRDAKAYHLALHIHRNIRGRLGEKKGQNPSQQQQGQQRRYHEEVHPFPRFLGQHEITLYPTPVATKQKLGSGQWSAVAPCSPAGNGYGKPVSLDRKTIGGIAIAAAVVLTGIAILPKKSNQTKVNVPASSPTHAHTNRLALEKSPYLLQHAHNPVDWYPWGEEAFTRARQENKPIFLSIGYSTCHWCHVMERESFEDAKVAKFLNDHFICIKVDREERPDVDQIYMTFVQAMNGQGGWPLNLFLTPDLKPFYGGTYFPPDARSGRPSLRQVLQNIAQLWQTRHGDVVNSAAELHQRLESYAERDATNMLVLTT